MAEICVYMTSVSSRLQISKQQRAILDFLDARGIEYTPIDMCANTKARGQMLEKLPEDSEGKKNFLPPQVFNGDEHCGDYESFFDARECDLIYSFFKLNPPEGSSEYHTANPPKEEDPEEEIEEVEEIEEEEEEEEVDHEAELKDVQPANEDTPMDAEGGEEKMELFAAMNKTEGEGVPDVTLVEEPVAEVSAENAENVGDFENTENAVVENSEEAKVDEHGDYIENLINSNESEAIEAVEEVEEVAEVEVVAEIEEDDEEVEYVEEKQVDSDAEVEEYNSDAE